MSDKVEWYVARSSGWVAFVLLACTVAWGVLGVSRIIERRGLPRWLLALHRHLAWLTVVFTTVHLVALVADDYLEIGWRELFVPFALDAYRPGAVTWGVAATYLLVAVQVTSWLRHRLPRRWWRGIHLLSYPMLFAATVHGLRAGTDADQPVVRAGVVAIVGAVSFLTLVRLLTAGPRRRGTGRVDTLTPDESQVEVDGDDPGVRPGDHSVRVG
jgi:sulfoxide reductase heme-binding subunit YedZ